jgi:hypothetical protein
VLIAISPNLTVVFSTSNEEIPLLYPATAYHSAYFSKALDAQAK